MNRSAGFSLVELLVSVSLLGILTATAVPNYQRYRRYVHDSAAQSDVRNVAMALQAEELANENGANFFFTRTGPTELPAPLEHISVSSGVALTAGKWDFSFTGGSNSWDYTYRYAYGYHPDGCHYFYRIDYYFTNNGNSQDFHYDYKFPYWGAASDCS